MQKSLTLCAVIVLTLLGFLHRSTAQNCAIPEHVSLPLDEYVQTECAEVGTVLTNLTTKNILSIKNVISIPPNYLRVELDKNGTLSLIVDEPLYPYPENNQNETFIQKTYIDETWSQFIQAQLELECTDGRSKVTSFSIPIADSNTQPPIFSSPNYNLMMGPCYNGTHDKTCPLNFETPILVSDADRDCINGDMNFTTDWPELIRISSSIVEISPRSDFSPNNLMRNIRLYLQESDYFNDKDIFEFTLKAYNNGSLSPGGNRLFASTLITIRFGDFSHGENSTVLKPPVFSSNVYYATVDNLSQIQAGVALYPIKPRNVLANINSIRGFGYGDGGYPEPGDDEDTKLEVRYEINSTILDIHPITGILFFNENAADMLSEIENIFWEEVYEITASFETYEFLPARVPLIVLFRFGNDCPATGTTCPEMTTPYANMTTPYVNMTEGPTTEQVTTPEYSTELPTENPEEPPTTENPEEPTTTQPSPEPTMPSPTTMHPTTTTTTTSTTTTASPTSTTSEPSTETPEEPTTEPPTEKPDEPTTELSTEKPEEPTTTQPSPEPTMPSPTTMHPTRTTTTPSTTTASPTSTTSEPSTETSEEPTTEPSTETPEEPTTELPTETPEEPSTVSTTGPSPEPTMSIPTTMHPTTTTTTTSTTTARPSTTIQTTPIPTTPLTTYPSVPTSHNPTTDSTTTSSTWLTTFITDSTSPFHPTTESPPEDNCCDSCKIIKDFECPVNNPNPSRLFPDPHDCSIYYQCISSDNYPFIPNKIQYSCQQGHSFCPEQQLCVNTGGCGCTGTSPSPNPIDKCPSNSTEHCETCDSYGESDPNNLCNAYQDEISSDLKLADPQYNDIYHSCVKTNGDTYIDYVMPCPETLHYCQSKDTCDFPRNCVAENIGKVPYKCDFCKTSETRSTISLYIENDF